MKFSVGEICWVIRLNGSRNECEIISVGTNTTGTQTTSTFDYTVDIPSVRHHSTINGWWVVDECQLKKKRPPRRDDIESAEDWFIEDLNNMRKHKEVVTE